MDQSLKNRFIQVRRRAIACDFSSLNEQQLKAILATDGPLLLLAGAGSGKTTVLIHRIANLLRYGSGSDSDFVPAGIAEDDVVFLEQYVHSPSESDRLRARQLCAVNPVPPWRVIAITFTNKAAGELKERLEKMLGPEATDIWAMTFHSACVRILRREIERLGFDRSFTIYDTGDSQSLMKHIMKDLNMDEKVYPIRSVLAQISAAKDAMISPAEFCENAAKSYDIRKREIGKAYGEYVRRLRDANALDFDDLILFTVRLLLENEDIRAYYQNKFQYVLIDEYQDTNNLQYLLASTLAGGHGNICVVGDDDQSIYKFRGATIENILNFEKQYKNARCIRLEQNYRSTGHILSASNSVIRHNEGRKGKELWTDHPDGNPLKLYVAYNEDDEAQYVAGQILAGYSAGARWRDFAVLYRMNAQSNKLEYAFKRNGIPYRVIGGMRFFDRAEVKDMLAYLSVINNPDDDLRLTRIINNPPRGIGSKTVDTAMEIAAKTSTPLFRVLENCKSYPDLQKSAAKLAVFTEMIRQLQEASASMPLDEFYDLVAERSGYIRALTEKVTVENTTRLENVNELKSNIIAYMKESDLPSLSGFLDEIALYTDIEQYDADSDCAVMMTMHSAKGLEFPTVFIAGAEDGIFPGMRAIGDREEMEEERRLCYVAMTRAKKMLYLTCARQRMLFGHTSANRMSRFIDEIPEKDIEKPARKQNPSPFADSTAQEYRSGYYTSRTVSRQSDRPSMRVSGITPPPRSNIAAVSFCAGDTVTHKAFGKGVIVSVKPVGSDALMEVNFEGVGLKRLMLKSASAHMTKE